MILVTGGAGYIGSHTCVELLNAGEEIVVADSFANSFPESLDAVREITGKSVAVRAGDLCEEMFIESLFDDFDITSVIHFAGLKAVGESVSDPLVYYQNNLVSTLNLARVMNRRGIYQLVFSSSATVYGEPEQLPLTEDCSTGPTNPYGHTKHIVEQILTDLAASDPAWRIALLRYFNPVGAHESGLIGEDPQDTPNNLMPFIAQVAVGRRDRLQVFGNDYDTPDGTGVRDYIHVVDLARGHLLALQYLENASGIEVFNLGTGNGHSVLEVIRAFEQASGKTIPFDLVARRPGDVAACFADAAKARQLLNWEAQFTLERMCEDSWRWQTGNPNGYRQ